MNKKTAVVTASAIALATATSLLVINQQTKTSSLVLPPNVTPLIFSWSYTNDISKVAYFQFYEVTNLQTGGRQKSFQVPAPNLRSTNYFTNKNIGFFVNTTVGKDGTESIPNIKTP